jgi:hypothetical protein
VKVWGNKFGTYIGEAVFSVCSSLFQKELFDSLYFNGLHRIISLKIELVETTTVRTSYPIFVRFVLGFL